MSLDYSHRHRIASRCFRREVDERRQNGRENRKGDRTQRGDLREKHENTNFRRKNFNSTTTAYPYNRSSFKGEKIEVRNEELCQSGIMQLRVVTPAR